MPAFAQGRESFHLFDGKDEVLLLEGESREQAFSLGLEALPAALSGADLDPFLSLLAEGPASSPATARKYFWRAVGEITLFNFIVFSFDHWVRKADFSQVSPATWWANLRRGWRFDDDAFRTNEGLHAYHGNTYFNSARANGYDFWESIPFTAFGVLFWQYFMENGQVDMCDISSGVFGGPVVGEVFNRVSMMLLDNTASGWPRFWRELAATVVNPAGGLVRLLNGDVKRDFPNPDDRFPSVLAVSVEGGYRRVAEGSETVSHASQGSFVVNIRYGDAFAGSLSNPFDVFEAAVEILQPASYILTRVQERGLVALGDIASSPAAEHKLGVFMNYEYLNDLQTFQEAFFSGALLSRFPLSASTNVRTELNLGLYPLTALQVDHSAADIAATGRDYDMGPGFGTETQVTLQHQGADLLEAGYRVIWTRTSGGISHHSTVQFAWVDATCPLTRSLALGAGWGWDHRLTSYDAFPTMGTGHSQWRVFAVLGTP